MEVGLTTSTPLVQPRSPFERAVARSRQRSLPPEHKIKQRSPHRSSTIRFTLSSPFVQRARVVSVELVTTTKPEQAPSKSLPIPRMPREQAWQRRQRELEKRNNSPTESVAHEIKQSLSLFVFANQFVARSLCLLSASVFFLFVSLRIPKVIALSIQFVSKCHK